MRRKRVLHLKNVNDPLHRVIDSANRMADKIDQMKQDTLRHPKIQQFIQKHQEEIDEEMINRSLSKLYEFSQASHHCEKCPSLHECVNVSKGLEPQLFINRNFIDVNYVVCPTQKAYTQTEKNKQLVSSLYMPKDVLTGQLVEVDILSEDTRVYIVSAANQFLQTYDQTGSLPEKGLYLHGSFGIGKSYILGAIANELAHRQVQTVIVYVPEFLREMKQSIQDQTLGEKIEMVKKAEVLMLDDIGAESMSAWTRDEVLGTILQYRMAEKLPTFFSSNFTIKELEHHLTYSQRGEKEAVKAARIIERILAVSVPMELKGKNRRRDS